MNLITINGVLASIFTGISLLPQLLKIIKRKKAGSVSLLMLATLLIGLILWVVYGILKNDYIIIISNGFSLIVNIITSVLTLKYKTGNKFPLPGFEKESYFSFT
jgi:MtN3 and saliva related transmembrane protein